MKILVIIVLLALGRTGTAQPPYSDSIMRIKGIWKKNGDYLTDASWHMPKDQQPPALQISADMQRLTKNAYSDLKGINAHYHTSIRGEPAIPKGPFPYTVGTMYFWYYYNTAYKKIIAADETGTHVRLDVNDPSYMLQPYTYNGKPQYAETGGKLHMIRELWVEAGNWKGYTVYKAPGKEAPGNYLRCAIITKDGPPLWLPVSQMQFLQMLRRQQEKDLNAVIPDYDKSDSALKPMIVSIQQMKVDEASKEKMIARQRELINQRAQKRDTTIKIRRNLWLKRIKEIDDYIASHSKETLESQAVLNMHEFFGAGFAKPGEQYRRRMVMLNPAYFDYTIPRYQPQFVVIRWSVNMNYAPCVYFKNQFEKNFSVEQLRTMLK